MKKIFAYLAIAVLPLAAGCAPHHKTHREARTVYHMTDGRYAYNDNGVWLYLMTMQSGRPTYVIGSPGTPVPSYSSAGWSRGATPSAREIAEAEEQPGEIEVNENGEPATAEEVAAETSAQQAEAQAEPSTDAAPSDTGSSDTGSSDTGSSDAGSSMSE